MQVRLSVGTVAPNFTSIDQYGKSISLSDYRGKKVILYFYPEDDTPGCTLQSCNLRDNHSALQSAGYVVLGVSGDGLESHKNFSDKFNLNFPIIVDDTLTISNLYGAYGEKNLYGHKRMGVFRYTYVIDEQGIITHVIAKVNAEKHYEQLLEKVINPSK